MTGFASGEDPRGLVDLLSFGELAIEGHLSGASNATLLCWIAHPEGAGRTRCVYKPRRGERPLWDFPTGTLGRREVATHLLTDLIGWAATPVTVWRDEGPLGPGMCQAWIDDDPTCPAVDVVMPSDVPAGWRIVLEAQTYDGRDVVLAHEDSLDLKRLAVLDIIANNADRKGGHVLRLPSGNPQGIDHGLTFHTEPKLRTVLWGWAGEDLDPPLLDDVTRLAEVVTEGSVECRRLLDYLSADEYQAFVHRVAALAGSGVFPDPDPEYPALPWPPM